jgi:carbon starvation protein
MSQAEYGEAMRSQGAVRLFAGGVAGFTDKIGLPHNAGIVFISLALAAFLMTTLDTATRLARFTWQELFLPRENPADEQPAAASKTALCVVFSNRYTATLFAVLASGWLLLGGGSKSIWPIFASSNQLLAALTLLGCSLWLLRHKRPVVIALIPMLFMILTSGSAIITIFCRSLRNWNANGFQAGGVMAITAGILFVMSATLIVLGAFSIKNSVKGK